MGYNTDKEQQIKLAKSILESAGYGVSKVNEDTEDPYEDFKNSMKSNPTYKKINDLCEKYAYKLYAAYNEKYKIIPDTTTINIRPTDDLHFDIYYEKSRESGEFEFTIQTAALGSLNLEKYAEFIAACQDSYNLVSELKKIDLSTLYAGPSKY